MKALVNLHLNTNFWLRIMKLWWLIDLKYIFFTFSKRDHVAFKLLNCLIFFNEFKRSIWIIKFVEINNRRTTNLFLRSVQKQPTEVFYINGVLKILEDLQGNTYARISFLIKLQAWNFILKENPTQAFSCEFC